VVERATKVTVERVEKIECFMIKSSPELL
jgi:hypothetical protein